MRHVVETMSTTGLDETNTVPATGRILVADDQRDVLTALELLFKAEGISAVTVTSPEAIISAIHGEPFDAVLMDLNYTRDTTSGEEGLDVLKTLASVPDAPPIIVMTAWGSIELAVEAMRRGACDFVTKPWDNRELIATVERNRQSRRKAAARYSRNELEVASQVQRKLWPGTGLSLQGFEIAGHCQPVGAVGGDTYDFFPLGPDALAFSLADVSGKGLPAALLMASLQSLLRSGADHAASDLAGFLEVANRHFYESTEAQHYATLFFALYRCSSRELRYVSCGHPAAILVAADQGPRQLAATAPGFGMFETLAPEVETVRLDAGDTLLVFSDGLLEARDDAGVELGEAQLFNILRDLLGTKGPALADLPRALIHEVVATRSYRQTDDVTVVAAQGGSVLSQGFDRVHP
jgi:sigma-B regulation protein RsbU (phosphoserine phosphatase)